jgi:hypothetical protein
MEASTLVTIGAVLVAVFLVIVAVMVWQEGRRRTVGEEGPTYVVEDAVDRIAAGLDATVDLRRSDIRRIVEYEVFYLQGLAQRNRRHPVEVVAGGGDAAVAFIADRIAEAHGVVYAHGDIRSVLALEAEYLASIGAVGEPVDESLLGGDDE